MVEVVKRHKAFGGSLTFYSHDSGKNNCKMNFGLFVPDGAENPACLWYLPGLTCEERRFAEKASLGLKYAAETGHALVFTDTSPRGIEIPGVADSWDFGIAAGFYLDATEAPWATNFNMYSYIT
jgi:S-formylglutathione hydrolase